MTSRRAEWDRAPGGRTRDNTATGQQPSSSQATLAQDRRCRRRPPDQSTDLWRGTEPDGSRVRPARWTPRKSRSRFSAGDGRVYGAASARTTARPSGQGKEPLQGCRQPRGGLLDLAELAEQLNHSIAAAAPALPDRGAPG